MLSQIKAPSFLRTSAVFEKIVQFTVNPYVVGSGSVVSAEERKAFYVLVGLYKAFRRGA